MNLDIIQNILKDQFTTDEQKQDKILFEISSDEHILFYFLKILEAERLRKKECMAEMQEIIADLDMIHTGTTYNRWNGGMKHVLERIEPLFKKWKPIIWHHVKGNYDK